jgi:hypothetical protein
MELEEIEQMLMNIPNIITERDSEMLTHKIFEDEILKVVQDLAPDKVPSPDGFSIHFFRSSSHTIRFDFVKMLQYVKKSNRLGRGTNSTFLVLIPKEDNPSSFSQFHPISLCDSSYKVLMKIITSRLKKVIPKVIYENQGGFMEK